MAGSAHGRPGSPPVTRSSAFAVPDTRADLATRLDLPDGEPTGFALLAHCFTCSATFVATARLARALVARGIGVLRLDLTGLGESGGRFADTTFSGDVADLVRAADELRARFAAPRLLVGHSLGGAAVVAAAERIPEVRAVATIGAPRHPGHVRGLVEPAPPPGVAAPVVIAGRRFVLAGDFLADIAAQPQERRLAELDVPLLVLHAPDDDVVPFAEARAIVATAPRASLVALDGADHLLTRPVDADRAAGLVAAWAAPYLLPADDELAGSVVVTETRQGRFTHRARSGDLEWAADEPVSGGGDGTGPDPYQLLLSALGACTSMTLRLYAERKGWPLRRTTVTLTHDRLHHTDCAECETGTGHVDRIVREIHLDGDLDADQRARLLQIADRCPVHRTLTGEILVETDEV